MGGGRTSLDEAVVGGTSVNQIEAFEGVVERNAAASVEPFAQVEEVGMEQSDVLAWRQSALVALKMAKIGKLRFVTLVLLHGKNSREGEITVKT